MKKNSQDSNFINSFKYALQGLYLLFLEERNAHFHLAATIFVICASFYFELATWEWMMIITCIGGVISVEALNTSIERLADFSTLEINPQIKIVKDLAASAVFIVALTAFIIGMMIFLPKILENF